MEPCLTASKIALSHERSLGPNVNDGPFVVMSIDDEKFIMLAVRRSVMAAKIVEGLRKDFGVSKAIVGIAFNSRESTEQGKLVLYPDPTCVGIYIPFNDLKGNVRSMLE